MPPFSFVYGGKESKTFITGWEFRSLKLPQSDPAIQNMQYSWRDRNFEGVEKASWWCYYTGKPNFCDQEWVKSATWSYDTIEPFNGAQSAKLTTRNSEGAVLAQSKIAIKKGMKYLFEGYFKADVPGLHPKVTLKVLNPDGTRMILGSAMNSVTKNT